MKLTQFVALFTLISTLFISCTDKPIGHEKLIAGIENIVKGNPDFNGVVVLAKADTLLFSKTQGYSDIEEKRTLTLQNQYVIGSVSKQITAVMIMKAYEEEKISLSDTIAIYLPELQNEWKNQVTIHHLLTHTHGIITLKDSLQFQPGTKFQYSQLGYQLLSEILETVYKKNFNEQATDLFDKLGMQNTFHPDNHAYEYLVKGYVEDNNGQIQYEENSLENYPAAGSFISDAEDLIKWNALLHGGKIVKEETLNLMKTRYATRDHPIFDQLDYGYGLLFNRNESSLQVGAFGYAPGFVSASYYYPETKLNLVVLSNVALNLDDFKKTFQVHTQVMELVKNAKNNPKE